MQLKDHIDRGLCSYSDTPFVNISNASTAFPLRIILKYALSVSACFGNSDRSWDFRFEHVEVSPVALTELRADVLGEVGAFIRHRHEHP